MTIQFNSDHNLIIHQDFSEKLEDMIKGALHRFEEHISRIEVFLSDENGSKEGGNDKKCVLEARIKGRSPIAVTEFANNHEVAVNGAIDKLESSLTTIFGRLASH